MPVVFPKRPQSFLAHTPVATAVFLALASSAVMAQQETTSLGEVIVTAQKRAESLQDVPISLDALGAEKMEELNVQNFKDYVQFLPSVTMAPSLGAGSGYSAVYMRGVATGGDGQATTSVPSVGMYLDEQPITTVQGNLDVHLYDIARVEALAGPQGTLYGASSQAGTIRIITNKPDPSGFAAGYSLEANYVDMDDVGYVAEGFVNLPMGDNAALRLVGWSVSQAGWIDNKLASRTYTIDQSTPADDYTTVNTQYVEDNYNTIDTIGARAALRINLGENWVVTPNLMYQKMEQEGSWGDDLQGRAGHRRPCGRPLPRRVHERRVVPGRPDDRGHASAASTWCIPATTSIATRKAHSTTRITRSSTTTSTPPGTSRACSSTTTATS